MGKRQRSKGSGNLIKRTPKGPWIALWYTHDGRRRQLSTKTTDRAAAAEILRKHVTDEALRRRGVVDPLAEAIADHARRPVAEQVDAWRESLYT